MALLNQVSKLTSLSGRSWAWLLAGLFLPAVLPTALPAQVQPAKTEPIFRDATFEQLANITITTASKHEERLFITPAAVSVIDANLIERLASTTVMDLLRFVPGVQVAQISPAAWGISVRGFNSQDSRKLLVMQDGRSVYDTLFSGVWWDVQDPALDNIARIEVVRGPGGTLWGANAVNGVINIISKPARDTQGSRFSATMADDGLRLASLRHGWALGRDTFARVTLQERRTGDAPLLSGAAGNNGHRLLTGSLRIDHGVPGENGFTLHGNFHSGRIRQALQLPVLTPPYIQLFTDEVEVAGVSLHGRWDRTDAQYGTITVQAYFDYFERGPVSLDQCNQTVDFDVQQQVPALGRHQLIWGASFRQVADKLGSATGIVRFDPPQRKRILFSGFVQDEIALVPEKLRWILGTKTEHNDYSGWEVQPSTRLLFTPKANQTYWAAVSRAVRTPDRTSDFQLRLATLPPAAQPGALPTEVVFQGNPAIQAESLLACEAGTRFEPTPWLRIEASLFSNTYDKLLNFSAGPVGLGMNPDRNISYVGEANQATGQTWGGELTLVWQVQERWRLTSNYSHLRMNLKGPGLPFLDNSAGQNPCSMFTLHSAHDWQEQWTLDLMGRYMDELPSWGIESYLEADVQLGWRSKRGLQINLFGRNLLHGQHFEAPSGRIGTPSAMVVRAIGLQLKHEF